jgi:transcriptional regulator with XRE-family HTH domain
MIRSVALKGGEALRVLRVYHDLNASKMSELLGISQGYLSEIENNKKEPSLKVINKYAEVFNTKSSVILGLVERLENPNLILKLKSALAKAVMSTLEKAAYAEDLD